MNSIATRILAITLALSASTSPAAPGVSGKTLALQGNGKGATSCATCHGKQGEGNASSGYPYLAGLPANYIRDQLTAYKNGKRKNAIMKPIASALTSQDMTAVADYYSKLKNNTLNNISATDVSVAKSGKQKTGATLAHRGKWTSSVPSCFKCHGDGGKGIAPNFPPIVGQPESYLRDQLLAWKNGKRSNDPIGLMQSVAKGLTRDDINAVAQYLSQAKP